MSDGITPQKFETLLLQLLFRDKDAQGKILPFLKSEVFDKFENREIVEAILAHHERYTKFPTIHELKLKIKNKDTFEHLTVELNKGVDEEYDDKFIKEEVEHFFRDKLLYNELFITLEGIKNGDDSIKSSAPDRMRDANAFSFDTSVGLDFFDSGEKLFESLHEKDRVIPTGIRNIDRLIKGGFHEKTLTLFLAETSLGKSLIKTAFASNALLQNKNVLYITLEMSENKVAERIMANLFDIEINNLVTVPKDRFMNIFEKTKQTIEHRLVLKEFPARSSSTNRIRNLLKELELKNRFIPDIIFVDYMGIMLPNSINRQHNTNTEFKVVSEELRGLAMELSIPIVSSIQTNRKGIGESELDLTDISESISTAFTADIVFAISQTDEMRTAGRYLFLLLKNRYGLRKIQSMVGVDYSKMRLYEVSDDNEDTDIVSPDTKLPKGTEHINIVDDTAVDILKTLKNNKRADKNKIIKGNNANKDIQM